MHIECPVQTQHKLLIENSFYCTIHTIDVLKFGNQL